YPQRLGIDPHSAAPSSRILAASAPPPTALRWRSRRRNRDSSLGASWDGERGVSVGTPRRAAEVRSVDRPCPLPTVCPAGSRTTAEGSWPSRDLNTPVGQPGGGNKVWTIGPTLFAVFGLGVHVAALPGEPSCPLPARDFSGMGQEKVASA